MILVRVTSSNLGQVSSDYNSHVTACCSVSSQAGISITAVLAAGLKRRMDLHGADTGLQRWQAVLSQFCLGFQSPFQCKFKAWTCLSMFFGFTALKSHIFQVCHLIYVVQRAISLIILFYFLNKDGWFPWERKGGNVRLLLLLLLVVGIQSVHLTEGISILGGKLPSLYLHSGVLHHFLSNVLSNYIVQDSHLHLWVSRGFPGIAACTSGLMLCRGLERVSVYWCV